MSYPSESRLKILMERVADIERQRHAPKDYEDVVFHGVVKSIGTLEPAESVDGDTTGDGSDCPHRYLEVVPYFPIISSAGHLEFDADEHPLIDVDEDTRREKVFVLNVPSHLIDLYYPVGEIVSYWRYSGTGEDTEKVRGSFVTRRDDLSFWAKVEWECYCPTDSDCTPTLPTFPKSAFQYKFTAYLPDPSAPKLQEKWKPFYPCDQSEVDGIPYTGQCFNLEEIFNGMGGKSGTGIKVNSSGKRTDIAGDNYIQPVGPLICKVTPIIDPDTERCDYKEFYFGPVTNQFGPSQVSASCTYCVDLWDAKLLCDGESPAFDMSYGNNTNGAEGISYVSRTCRIPPKVTGQWVKLSHNTEGNFCRYQFYRVGKCCAAIEAPCDDFDPEVDTIPELPDPVPEDCCTTKCIFHLQVSYDCSHDEGDRWSVITVVDADTTCDVPTGSEGEWDEGTTSGTVTTFNYYYVGDACVDAESCSISPGEYPELPDEPVGPKLPCCPGEAGKKYVLTCTSEGLAWEETGTC